MSYLGDCIVKPLLTEKSSELTEKHNRYCFVVKSSAKKSDIKVAIESLFDVKVNKINTTVTAGNSKRTAKGYVKKPSVKKAYVTVADGQKIQLFKGI